MRLINANILPKKSMLSLWAVKWRNVVVTMSVSEMNDHSTPTDAELCMAVIGGVAEPDNDVEYHLLTMEAIDELANRGYADVEPVAADVRQLFDRCENISVSWYQYAPGIIESMLRLARRNGIVLDTAGVEDCTERWGRRFSPRRIKQLLGYSALARFRDRRRGSRY